LPSQGQEEGRILITAYVLETYIGIDEQQCRYIRGRCSYVCRTTQGKQTRALWGVSWYHWRYNVIFGVSHKPRSL